jgi:hypothetical protein
MALPEDPVPGTPLIFFEPDSTQYQIPNVAENFPKIS